MMQGFGRDLRFALRTLIQSPGFTAVAALTLALGIGVNTAVFSVVDAVLLEPLPFRDPDRLVMVWETEGKDDTEPVSPANWLDWRRQSRAFEGLEALFPRLLNLSGGDEPERVSGLEVSPGFFRLLGVEAELGRVLSADVEPGGREVVLSHEFWRRRFGEDPAIVGRSLTLDGEVCVVVGVMPSSFQFPLERADVWIEPPIGIPRPPLDIEDELSTVRGLHFLRVVGRLRPDVSVERARSEMAGLARRLAEEYPDDNRGRGAQVVLLSEQVVGDVRPALMVLLGAVGFVLLIACVNVAGLLLSRAVGREKEMAVRATLGASRTRLAGQLLTESLALSLLGGALGTLFSLWARDLFLALGPEDLPRISEAALNLRVLTFAAAVSTGSGLFFGVVPALRTFRTDLGGALKEGLRGSGGGRHRRVLNRLLVVAEMGLALVLLVAAGLLIRSFVALQRVDAGFDPGGVLTLRVWLPEARYPKDAQLARFYREVLARVRSVAGVQSAAWVMGAPLSGTQASFTFLIEGRADSRSGAEHDAGFQAVSPGYFRTLGIPLLEGRDFTSRDRRETPPVAIINQALRERFWPGASPVGDRISYDGEEWIEVVGVVGNVRQDGLDRSPGPEIFLPIEQSPLRFMTLVARTAGDPLALTGPVRGQLQAVDPELPVYKVMPLETILADSIARDRFNSLVLGAFGMLALTLAAVGLYGLMSYSVGQRSHEMGVRMALGARGGDLLRLVLGEGILLALAGAAWGLAASWLASRILSGFLFGVTPRDPSTFAATAVLLVAVALVASYLPARRATRVDPLAALRYE